MHARIPKSATQVRMRYLHTMVRVRDLPAALRFFCEGLGPARSASARPRAGPLHARVPRRARRRRDSPQIELTHNWDHDDAYTGGRNFGHVAYEVDDIYAACQRLVDHGYTISRPPRDGRMAFVRSPDLVSVELLQKGEALAAAEPWTSMPNVGEW